MLCYYHLLLLYDPLLERTSTVFLYFKGEEERSVHYYGIVSGDKSQKVLSVVRKDVGYELFLSYGQSTQEQVSKAAHLLHVLFLAFYERP